MPLQRNVRFFASAAAAEAGGYLACKRCRPTLASPLVPHETTVRKACTLLGTSDGSLSMSALAAAVGVSRFHFHRIFKAVLGTTPGDYAQTVRWARLTDDLDAGRPVGEAIARAGFHSPSRAYDRARRMIGMTPAERRAGGKGRCVGFVIVQASGRSVLVAATGDGVCAIELGEDPALLEAGLRRRLPAATVVSRNPPDVIDRIAAAVLAAGLPPRAREFPAEIRDVAFRARLRKAIGPGLIADLWCGGMAGQPPASTRRSPGRAGAGRRSPARPTAGDALSRPRGFDS
jgi:AraC family transcriptional regulator of adaptative response/methylated-DNA-[protein]-cysteine methyltransferase